MRKVFFITAIIFCFSQAAYPQPGARPGEWHFYAGDPKNTRYSPLDQITPENVNHLKLVWRWDSPDEDVKARTRARPGFFKGTPLMIDGVLYVSTSLNQVAALDAETGETIWLYDPKAYLRRIGGGAGFQHRGVAYWRDSSDGKDDERVFIATRTRQLIALNAGTGKPIESFGLGGYVELAKGLGKRIIESQLGFSAPPTIVRDTIILGGITPDEAPNYSSPPGHVRGFDVRTGRQKWIFHTIPEPGEFGNETWEAGSWKTSGSANAWSMMSVDEELGYVYVPTGTPINDFYGGHRLGNNLFAESVICLNAETGRRIWHFQGVHHGLWDYDFPAAPILVDVGFNGKPIKALAQVSKQGFTYVFDRVTGDPVWPIEERPVPRSAVPGERSSWTQPIPTKPPPFERQGISEEDLIDFTPELRREALEVVRRYHLGPLFTPPTLIDQHGYGGVIQVPGSAGGANWGSAGVDPETGILYVQSATQPSVSGLVRPDPARSRFRYKRGGPWGLPPRPSGLPLTKPPYGRITAIDLNKGEILWQVPHGDGPRDHPLLKDLDLPPLGAPSNTFVSNSGPVITKTLVIYSHVEVEPDGSYSKTKWWLYAYEKQTGKVLMKKRLPLPPYAVPMTYLHRGKQYIVVGAGGAGQPGALLAYAVP